jgi:hypothetical protein
MPSIFFPFTHCTRILPLDIIARAVGAIHESPRSSRSFPPRLSHSNYSILRFQPFVPQHRKERITPIYGKISPFSTPCPHIWGQNIRSFFVWGKRLLSPQMGICFMKSIHFIPPRYGGSTTFFCPFSPQVAVFPICFFFLADAASRRQSGQYTGHGALMGSIDFPFSSSLAQDSVVLLS